MALSRAEGESRALVFTDDSGVCRPVSILTSSCVAASTSAADADWLEYEAGVDEECTSDFPCAWVSAAGGAWTLGAAGFTVSAMTGARAGFDIDTGSAVLAPAGAAKGPNEYSGLSV